MEDLNLGPYQPRRSGISPERLNGEDLYGQLTYEERNSLSRFAQEWDQPIVLSGSMAETKFGFENRYNPYLEEYLPPYRARKRFSGLVDWGKGDIDIWEGSNLEQWQLYIIKKRFYGWDTDQGYKLIYYPTLDSLSQGGGALVFMPDGSIYRIPAPWQLPGWPFAP